MEPQHLEIALWLAFLVLSLGVHEAAHAWVALLCGDSTARDEGRLTLNPIPHIDPFWTILLPAVLMWVSGVPFGGARPVPVVARNLRHPLRDMMLVALAGPISNVLLAFLFLLVFKVMLFFGGMEMGQLAPRVMYLSMYTNLLLAVFNMIPIPPLDGSRVMAYFLPTSLRDTYVGLERFGMLIVIGLLYFGAFRAVMEPTVGVRYRFPDGHVEIGQAQPDGRVKEAPFVAFLQKATGGRWKDETQK